MVCTMCSSISYTSLVPLHSVYMVYETYLVSEDLLEVWSPIP